MKNNEEQHNNANKYEVRAVGYHQDGVTAIYQVGRWIPHHGIADKMIWIDHLESGNAQLNEEPISDISSYTDLEGNIVKAKSSEHFYTHPVALRYAQRLNSERI